LFEWIAQSGRPRIVAPDRGESVPATKLQPEVVALARAWWWQRLLDDGVYASVSDIGDVEDISRSYVSRILRLALLAPDMVQAILTGSTDQGMMLEQLERPLPLNLAGAARALRPVSMPCGSDARLESSRLSRSLSATSASFAAHGITDSTGLRAAPSAGALYPLKLTLVAGHVPGLAAGVYQYDPRRHELVQSANGDRRHDLATAAFGQTWLAAGAKPLLALRTSSSTRSRISPGRPPKQLQRDLLSRYILSSGSWSSGSGFP
jgi:hypothetical protein